MRINDGWFRVSTIVLPSLLMVYGVFSNPGPRAVDTWVALVFILSTCLLCEGNRLIIYRSRSWFGKNGWQRRFLVLLTGIGFSSLVLLTGKVVRNLIRYGEPRWQGETGSSITFNSTNLTSGVLGFSLFYGLLVFLFLYSIYGWIYSFARLRQAEKERDRLEREKLQAELQQLKGIVNPHFLFNNLNSLSSLISEDPARAESFLEELTRVFRYLLRNSETDLVTLGQELQFLHSYFHLLQTRYGKGISISLRIDPDYEAFLLPPLTLQLLVENAVKHNRVQRDEPLQIELFSAPEHQLVVRNAVLPREKRSESTGIGLYSINSRYRLLNRPPLRIEQNASFFSVCITLVEPEIHFVAERKEADSEPQRL